MGGSILDYPAVSGRFSGAGRLSSNPNPERLFRAGQPEPWCSDIP